MSIDLINANGSHWKTSLNRWGSILLIARERGWITAGTILYKESDDVSGLNIVNINGIEAMFVETSGDRAHVFEATKRSQEIYEEWDISDYFSNSGQVITALDAANLADAIAKAGKKGDFGEWDGYHELISFLKEGECMIW
jgi:hypothetical protein